MKILSGGQRAEIQELPVVPIIPSYKFVVIIKPFRVQFRGYPGFEIPSTFFRGFVVGQKSFLYIERIWVGLVDDNDSEGTDGAHWVVLGRVEPDVELIFIVVPMVAVTDQLGDVRGWGV